MKLRGSLTFIAIAVAVAIGCGSSDDSTFDDLSSCIQNDNAPVVPPPPVK